jgi:hypothetical protein
MKEILLVIAVIFSLVLLFYTFNTLNKLTTIEKSRKNLIIYISILFPIGGALWVTILKNKIIN